MKKKTYSEKLRDPRWQKLRLQILERDEWTCQICSDKESTLNVHHRYYLHGKDPWEYPPEALETLCEDCHRSETENRHNIEQMLLFYLRQKFSANDLIDLSYGISSIKLEAPSNIVATAYMWAFSEPEIQKELIERYHKNYDMKKRRMF